MTEWFEQWFGEEYLRLYPHRDEEDAARLVALIDGRLGVAQRRLLDLACGPGRHAAQFTARGARVVGVDLSLTLLVRARRRGVVTALVRADMRALPFRDRTFEIVVNLFTSFGYFADDAQHRRVLADAARLLQPGGAFVLDYLNAGAVRARLVPDEERHVGDRHVAIARRITADGRFVVKEIRLADEARSFVERVRLFSPEDLERLLGEAGLRVRERFGDYEGAPLTDGAPRAILFAERT